MAKVRGFKAGQVVWATVPDRNGIEKPDPRPLLLIYPDPANKASPLCCLAISTKPGEDPNDPAIEMPWDAKTGDTTGLHEWCRVVLLWHVLVDQSRVQKTSGQVTNTFLDEVIAARANAMVLRKPK